VDPIISLLPEPIPLRPILPTVLGNVDYHLFRGQLEQIDTLLGRTGLEDQFVQLSVKRWRAQNAEAPPSPRSQLLPATRSAGLAL